jgi:hypothetical protein
MGFHNDPPVLLGRGFCWFTGSWEFEVTSVSISSRYFWRFFEQEWLLSVVGDRQVRRVKGRIQCFLGIGFLQTGHSVSPPGYYGHD